MLSVTSDSSDYEFRWQSASDFLFFVLFTLAMAVAPGELSPNSSLCEFSSVFFLLFFFEDILTTLPISLLSKSGNFSLINRQKF